MSQRRNNTPQPPRIEIHIEEMVLHGVAPAMRDAVADAIRRELAATFAQPGAISHLNGKLHVPHVDAVTVAEPAGLKPEAVGIGVARAVHKGLRR